MFNRNGFEQDLDHFPEAIFAWLDGDTAPAVDRAVNEWLGAAPENRSALRELSTIWKLSKTPPPEAGWSRLEKRIDEIEIAASVKVRSGISYMPTNGDSVWLRLAAVLLVGLGLGLLWPHVSASFDEPTFARVVVPAGSQTSVKLPGGVSVRLSYASELAYVPSNDVREILLSGEAYITVPDGENRNLIVRTEAGIVRDLGTKFNVRARSGTTSVVVTEGKVKLETPRGDVTLEAGQETSVKLGQAPAPASAVNLDAALAWMTKRLTFYNAPLAEVAQELEYRYGAAFRIMDPGLRTTRITAKISSDASAGDAAEVICIAIQARCTREGEQWLISAR